MATKSAIFWKISMYLAECTKIITKASIACLMFTLARHCDFFPLWWAQGRHPFLAMDTKRHLLPNFPSDSNQRRYEVSGK